MKLLATLTFAMALIAPAAATAAAWDVGPPVGALRFDLRDRAQRDPARQAGGGGLQGPAAAHRHAGDHRRPAQGPLSAAYCAVQPPSMTKEPPVAEAPWSETR